MIYDKNFILGKEVDIIKLSNQTHPELYGNKFYFPDGSGMFYDYKSELLNAEGFIGKYSGKQFYEMIGEYTYNIGTDEEQKTNELLKNRKKRVIIYQLVS